MGLGWGRIGKWGLSGPFGGHRGGWGDAEQERKQAYLWEIRGAASVRDGDPGRGAGFGVARVTHGYGTGIARPPDPINTRAARCLAGLRNPSAGARRSGIARLYEKKLSRPFLPRAVAWGWCCGPCRRPQAGTSLRHRRKVQGRDSQKRTLQHTLLLRPSHPICRDHL